MIKLRIIGDVHGMQGRYCNLAKQADLSICLGDVGMSFGFISEHLDPVKHRIVGGNHDNYNELSPHFLDDYGMIYVFENEIQHQSEEDLQGDPVVPDDIIFPPIFYVRGAFSVDKRARTVGVSWWAQEELSYYKSCEAIRAYKRIKPNIVISHDCPHKLVHLVATNDSKFEPSFTGKMLQEMYDYHKPETWIFVPQSHSCGICSRTACLGSQIRHLTTLSHGQRHVLPGGQFRASGHS